MNKLACRLAAISIVALPGFAEAENRAALVIGNGRYAFGPLENPVNDARSMISASRETGFDVLEGIDLDRKSMRRAIQAFGRKLESAGSGATGLFHFSGRGLQARDENFLIPVDAAASPAAAPAATAPPAINPDAQACEVLRSTPAPSVIEAYLKEFPNGVCAGYARIRREARRTAVPPDRVASLPPEVKAPPNECVRFSGELRDTCAKAVAGDASAEFDLGMALRDGNGVAKDTGAAAEWSRKSAQGGWARSQLDWGYADEMGQGVPVDLRPAAEMYRKAAEQGDVISMTNYAFTLLNGRGVPVDRDEARVWLRRAAEAGGERARQLLASTGG